jgi:Flp pilus assembly protein TadD
MDPATALAAAKRAYDVAPSVHAADVLAWAYFRNGRCQEAVPLSREALRLGTLDGLKLFHGGMIAACAGDTDGARALLRRALEANPNFSLRHAGEARAKLAQLENAP